MNGKISLIGCGTIGSILALHIANKRLCSNLVLLDINKNNAKGKALDLAQSLTVTGNDTLISGTDDYADIVDSKVVVITAGIPRKDGMTRDDLLNFNKKVISHAAQQIKKYCPDAFIITVTNPVDVMVWLTQKESGLPHNKVVGMAGILDTARFKLFLAQKLNVSSGSITSFLLGGHGDSMVMVNEYTTINGIPLTEFIENGIITQNEIDEIVQRTISGGGEIVQLLGNGSAFFAPAASILEMIESYLFNKRSVMPCSVAIPDNYPGLSEYSGTYVGLPVIIGKNGIEKILPISVHDNNMQQLANSAQAVLERINKL